MKPLYLCATSKARTGWDCCKACTKRLPGSPRKRGMKRAATRGGRARLRYELRLIEVRNYFEAKAESDAMERLEAFDAATFDDSDEWARTI